MTKIVYKTRAFQPASLRTLQRAEAICQEYEAQGYDLTLRQLYYQFVARGWLENSQRSYNNLGNLVSDGRMAGHLDWDHIVDRTRSPRGNSHWDSPAQIIRGAAYSYRRDKWANQPTRDEVWVEKEALAGVVQRAASAMDCSYFSCRGYVSQSAMWRAARRITGHLSDGTTERVVILHLGDHDPSGMDMTRDIRERLGTFIGSDFAYEQLEDLAHERERDGEAFERWLRDEAFDHMNRLEVNRIALNTPQIEEYDPPPNPAKLTDSRASGYVERYGYESWELDALPPDALDELIRDEIGKVMDTELYAAEETQEQAERDRLLELARTWS